MKQKIIILLITVLTGMSACNMVKAPEFKGISGLDIKKNKQGKYVLVADATFHNPNLVGGKFRLKDIKVFVNDKYFANLNADTYQVPTKKDFSVPLEVNFDHKYFNKNNILDALNNLLNNKLKVKYQGKIYYVSHKMNIPYNIDYEDEIKITK